MLPLSALGASQPDAVVVDQRGSQRWLITPTADFKAGTALARALSLTPDLKVLVRRPAAEWTALESLAYWIYRFGQPVTAEIQDLAEPGRSPRALLWVEIGHSLALFGGLKALRDLLCGELLTLGHAAQVGIAPTRAGAALLACAVPCDSMPVREAQDGAASAPTSLRSDTATRPRAGHFEPIHDTVELKRTLARLPLSLLHWPGERLHALDGVGLRTLGDLFALPRDAFAKRFGVQAQLALDRLLGLASEPCDTLVPPETFRRRFELSAEIEEVERLQFPLKRLCTELQAYLRARDRGLRGVTLTVSHAGARQTRLHAQFVDPHRDAQRIFDALRERLERDGLPLPARELLLIAEDFDEASVPQSDLFDARAGQAQAWAAAIERIRGRLGDDKLWVPMAVADHRPEHAMRRAPLPEAIDEAASLVTQPRPSLLMTEPWAMPPPVLPPDAAFERIESGWWDGGDVHRDYTVLDINGGRAWVYREIGSGQWYLHGWFS
jgi:protein ImuB|nr:DNA polymerase Y family protein [Panacagrimonas sp.]